MTKLDDLDAYTRTQIKNEIATERVNYVAQQRTAIESGLNAKIQQFQQIQQNPNVLENKDKYDPIIKKILVNITNNEPVDGINMYTMSSIIKSSE